MSLNGYGLNVKQQYRRAPNLLAFDWQGRKTGGTDLVLEAPTPGGHVPWINVAGREQKPLDVTGVNVGYIVDADEFLVPSERPKSIYPIDMEIGNISQPRVEPLYFARVDAPPSREVREGKDLRTNTQLIMDNITYDDGLRKHPSTAAAELAKRDVEHKRRLLLDQVNQDIALLRRVGLGEDDQQILDLQRQRDRLEVMIAPDVVNSDQNREIIRLLRRSKQMADEPFEMPSQGELQGLREEMGGDYKAPMTEDEARRRWDLANKFGLEERRTQLEQDLVEILGMEEKAEEARGMTPLQLDDLEEKINELDDPNDLIAIDYNHRANNPLLRMSANQRREMLDFLHKPFTVEDLSRKVSRTLQMHLDEQMLGNVTDGFLHSLATGAVHPIIDDSGEHLVDGQGRELFIGHLALQYHPGGRGVALRTVDNIINPPTPANQQEYWENLENELEQLSTQHEGKDEGDIPIADKTRIGNLISAFRRRDEIIAQAEAREAARRPEDPQVVLEEKQEEVGLRRREEAFERLTVAINSGDRSALTLTPEFISVAKQFMPQEEALSKMGGNSDMLGKIADFKSDTLAVLLLEGAITGIDRTVIIPLIDMEKTIKSIYSKGDGKALDVDGATVYRANLGGASPDAMIRELTDIGYMNQIQNAILEGREVPILSDDEIIKIAQSIEPAPESPAAEVPAPESPAAEPAPESPASPEPAWVSVSRGYRNMGDIMKKKNEFPLDLRDVARRFMQRPNSNRIAVRDYSHRMQNRDIALHAMLYVVLDSMGDVQATAALKSVVNAAIDRVPSDQRYSVREQMAKLTKGELSPDDFAYWLIISRAYTPEVRNSLLKIVSDLSPDTKAKKEAKAPMRMPTEISEPVKKAAKTPGPMPEAEDERKVEQRPGPDDERKVAPRPTRKKIAKMPLDNWLNLPIEEKHNLEGIIPFSKISQRTKEWASETVLYTYEDLRKNAGGRLIGDDYAGAYMAGRVLAATKTKQGMGRADLDTASALSRAPVSVAIPLLILTNVGNFNITIGDFVQNEIMAPFFPEGADWAPDMVSDVAAQEAANSAVISFPKSTIKKAMTVAKKAGDSDAATISVMNVLFDSRDRQRLLRKRMGAEEADKWLSSVGLAIKK